MPLLWVAFLNRSTVSATYTAGTAGPGTSESISCIHDNDEPVPILRMFLDLQEILKLRLHGEIYRSDSFVLMLRYCANLKAIRYESTSLNKIVADKSHCVIVA